VKPLWLIGEHIAHSRSPAMHNAALEALGEPPVYALRPTSAAALEATLHEAELTCAGINVTAPHKLEVARRYHALLDDDARATGAVNTVVFADGRAVRALNTDVEGLVATWRRSAVPVEGRTVAVVGAGGAARAVVVAAARAGAQGIVVHARRIDAARALITHAQGQGLEAIAASEPCGAAVCIVAASQVDDPEALLARTLGGAGFVHDLRYGTNTHPLRDATLRRRMLYADGTGLLYFQGVSALAAFRGHALPDVATAAMRRALTRS
jgi:shikimate dehydrogenase